MILRKVFFTLMNYCFVVYIKTDDIYKDIADLLKQDLILQIVD